MSTTSLPPRESTTGKLRISVKKAIGLAAAAVLIILACGFVLYRHERSKAEAEPIPTGEHRFSFTGVNSRKQIGENTFHILQIKQEDSLWHPAFQITLSPAPDDAVNCPSPELKSAGRVLSRAEGSSRIVEHGTRCVWQQYTSKFENGFREAETRLTAKKSPQETHDVVQQAADSGDNQAMVGYVSMYALTSDAASTGLASFMRQFGVDYDPARADLYIRVLRAREGEFTSDFRTNFEKILTETSNGYISKGAQLNRSSAEDAFPQAQAWFRKAAELGSADGMLHYLSGCVVQGEGSRIFGRQIWPGFVPDQHLAEKYMNDLGRMEDAQTLSDEQRIALQNIRANWTHINFATPVFASGGVPEGDPSSSPSPMYSDDKIEIESLEKKPYYDGCILTARIRNKTDQRLAGVIIHLNAFDDSGALMQNPSIVVFDVPPHSIAAKDMNGALNKVPAVVKVTGVVYQ